MDDEEKEYAEIMKAEADQKRDTTLVMHILKIITVLLAIGVLVSFTDQILFFINAVLP